MVLLKEMNRMMHIWGKLYKGNIEK